MTSEMPPAGSTPTQFPPIPLVSGDTFRDENGVPHKVATITVTMTAEDGTTHDTVLEYRFGGWWPPAAV